LPALTGSAPWWRQQSSLQFALLCLGCKNATEVLGLDWAGISGFLHAADPTFDYLAFFPACVIVFELARRIPGAAGAVARLAGILAVEAGIIADLLTEKFFHAHVSSVLPVLLETHAISATGSNLRGLVPSSVIVVSAIFVVWAIVAFVRGCPSKPGTLLPAVLILGGYVFTVNRGAAVQATLDAVTHEQLDYTLGTGNKVAEKPLHAAEHTQPEIRREARFAPRTIILFINESCPWQFASSSDPKEKLFDKVIGESGLEPADWHIFDRAFTNSSTTDISMPCIMTGSDPTAGTELVERLPFLYSMAKARGYTTGFFTSQDYSWVNMRTFFASKQLDEFVSSEITGQATANLLGIDDMYIARKITDFVRSKGPDGRLFLVINNNALHVPFQTESSIPIPAFAKDPKQRAGYIIEQFYSQIFDSLRNNGRLKDALIIVTSDHGEMDPERKRDVIRLDSHYDEVMNIPMGIYLPAGAPEALRQGLEGNRNRTVANMDIAPTLMDALGLALPPSEKYPGFDLFLAVPSDRVSVSVSNNEWKPWHLSAFGVACGDDRLIFHQKLGLMYFNVRTDPAEAAPATTGTKFDAYRAYVAVHPTLAKWLNSSGSD